MEIRCPHCGKKQSLSVAKLNASGGVVICPQCVSEFTVDLSQLPSESVPQEPAETHNAPAAQGEIAFCPSCGNRLPAKGLNFCPYCGSPLPFSAAAPAQSSPSIDSHPSAQPSSTEEASPAAHTAADKTVDQRLSALPFVKTPDFITHQHEPASLRFRIVAWLIILLLLFLFVLMLWKGNME